MTATDDLLANNAEYAAAFSGPLPLLPAKGVAVVACMDARINVYGVLGLQEGEAHVIRNAGGVITDDEIRSLTISQRLLGTKEIILIHQGGRGVRRPRRGRPPVRRSDQGQPLHPEQGLGTRFRVRRRHRKARRGLLTGRGARPGAGQPAQSQPVGQRRNDWYERLGVGPRWPW